MILNPSALCIEWFEKKNHKSITSVHSPNHIMISVGCYVQPLMYRLIKLMTSFRMHGIWTNSWSIYCIFASKKYSDSTFYAALGISQHPKPIHMYEGRQQNRAEVQGIPISNGSQMDAFQFHIKQGSFRWFLFYFLNSWFGPVRKKYQFMKMVCLEPDFFFLISVEKRKKSRLERTHIFFHDSKSDFTRN